eukprot:1662349-Pyramimonas_sp.AAC.1
MFLDPSHVRVEPSSKGALTFLRALIGLFRAHRQQHGVALEVTVQGCEVTVHGCEVTVQGCEVTVRAVSEGAPRTAWSFRHVGWCCGSGRGTPPPSRCR